jgi:hypothetical protein
VLTTNPQISDTVSRAVGYIAALLAIGGGVALGIRAVRRRQARR